MVEAYRVRGEQLPFTGGFDLGGNLTRDPGAIEASQRPLPIGYWKGSGLALMLDLLASVLSGGHATHQIPANSLQETGLSQMFLAFDLRASDKDTAGAELVNQIIEFVQGPDVSRAEVRYPGQRSLKIRKQNMVQGIPVAPDVWQQVQGM